MGCAFRGRPPVRTLARIALWTPARVPIVSPVALDMLNRTIANRIVASLGAASYSIYPIHPYVIGVADKIAGIRANLRTWLGVASACANALLGLYDKRPQRAKHRRRIKHRDGHEAQVGITTVQVGDERLAIARLAGRHHVIKHEHIARRRVELLDKRGRARARPRRSRSSACPSRVTAKAVTGKRM